MIQKGVTVKKRLLPRMIISAPSLMFWIAVAIFDRTMQASAALTAAILHELGHIAVIKLCGIRITSFTVLPYGLEMSTDRRPRSFFEDVTINSAGCAVNLLSFPIFYSLGAVIHGNTGIFLLNLSAASVALGILNALPISTLDGGSVAEALLSMRLSSNTVYRIMRAVSFAFLILLWLTATYVFMFSGYNYTLFAMAVWLFARLFLQKNG